MTVLFISPCPYDSGWGGIQKSALVTWDSLVTQGSGVEARLLCFGTQCDAPPPADSTPRAWCSSSKAGMAWQAVRTRLRPDVVLFWHLGMLKLLPFLRIGTSSKVAVYLHGTEAWAPFDRSVNRLMNRVDLFLANSDFTWLRFGDQHPELVNKPWRRVALGLGEPAPAADASSRPVAIMIGRMARTEGYKGHGEVLEAWPMVERALPGAELCIVGTGDLEADLRGRAKRLALNSVRFTGSVTEQQKHELLCQSRCLLMPSSGEGFGLVYLEAMRLGRPCLVSHLDAGQEVVNPPEAGLAADRSNMPELSSAVVRLLADTPEQRSMSVNAKRRYEAHFTARHFSSRLLRALEEMVHPGGRVEALREELV